MPAKGTKVIIDPETGERRVVQKRNKAKNIHAESSRTPGTGNMETALRNAIPGESSALALSSFRKAHALNTKLTPKLWFDQIEPVLLVGMK